VQSVVQMSGGAPGLKLSNGSTVALTGVASIL
jgi:flagellar basal-body rod modification protein FlgD